MMAGEFLDLKFMHLKVANVRNTDLKSSCFLNFICGNQINCSGYPTLDGLLVE